MRRLLKVKDHAGIVRDASTGAILATDKSEYQNRLSARRKAEEAEKVVKDLETMGNRIDKMEAKLDRLLELLSK